MRRPVTVARSSVVAFALVLGACGAGPETGRRPEATAQPAAAQQDEQRAQAIRQIETLEAAVGRVRARVEAAAASSGRMTRERQLLISEARRAIVVANVSLQKARTALVQGDYDAVGLETVAAVARLEPFSEGNGNQ